MATVVTAKVSNRSAAMPAQSPTLSPTLSAIVAGLRGSSSGIPASTLPTMSPPTSAPLVKMPPPRRAKIEISEAPKPSATSEFDDDAALLRRRRCRDCRPYRQERVVAGNADQAEADDQHAGHRARAERHRKTLRQTLARRFRRAHIGAHRDVHADIAGRAGERRADQVADRHLPAEEREARARRSRRRRWRSSCTGDSR